MSAPIRPAETVTAGREAWPFWRCPACRAPNDQLRHVCRYCEAFRPCEHYDGERRCGATPVHMFHDGPRCETHRALPARGRRQDTPSAGVVLTDGSDAVAWADLAIGAWAATFPADDDPAGRGPVLARRLAASRPAARAAAAVALHLGIPLADVGPCIACGMPHWRYGDGGRPRCAECSAPATATEAELGEAA